MVERTKDIENLGKEEKGQRFEWVEDHWQIETGEEEEELVMWWHEIGWLDGGGETEEEIGAVE